MADKLEFKKGDFVVYPAHGVGRVEGVDTFSIAGLQVMWSSLPIAFEQALHASQGPVLRWGTSACAVCLQADRHEAISTPVGRHAASCGAAARRTESKIDYKRSGSIV